jgi:hypothetical protein
LWNRCVANVKSTLSEIAAAPFRAALAVAVLFMLLMQPSAYAKAAASLADKAVPAATGPVSPARDASGPPSERRGAGHIHAVEHADHDSSAHGGGGHHALAENCCDLQCSPAAWIPSFQEDVNGQLTRSFELADVERLPLGGYEAAIRPPRR